MAGCGLGGAYLLPERLKPATWSLSPGSCRLMRLQEPGRSDQVAGRQEPDFRNQVLDEHEHGRAGVLRRDLGLRQIPEHLVQDPAVSEVLHLDRRVDAADRVEGDRLAARLGDLDPDPLARL